LTEHDIAVDQIVGSPIAIDVASGSDRATSAADLEAADSQGDVVKVDLVVVSLAEHDVRGSMARRSNQQVGDGIPIDITNARDRLPGIVARTVRLAGMAVLAENLVATDSGGHIVEVDLAPVGLAPDDIGRARLVRDLVVTRRADQQIVLAIGVEVAGRRQGIASPVAVVVASTPRIIERVLADDFEAAVAGRHVGEIHRRAIGLAEDDVRRARVATSSLAVTVSANQQVRTTVAIDVPGVHQRAGERFIAARDDLVTANPRGNIAQVELPVRAEGAEQDIHRPRRANRNVAMSITIDVAKACQRGTSSTIGRRRGFPDDQYATHALADVVERNRPILRTLAFAKQRVVAAAADHVVGAGQAEQLVVARAAGNDVVQRIASARAWRHQRQVLEVVGKGGVGVRNITPRNQQIRAFLWRLVPPAVLGIGDVISVIAGTPSQVHPSPRGTSPMHQRVVAFTSVEVVHSRPATEQAVIPSPAFQRVDTFSTIQHVVTSQAPQHVVAVATAKEIGLCATDQVVHERGSGNRQFLDAGVDHPVVVAAEAPIRRVRWHLNVESDTTSHQEIALRVIVFAPDPPTQLDPRAALS